MKIINLNSQLTQHIDYHTLSDEKIVNLCIKSKEALISAYAPYSNYRVGAAILLDNEQIIQGSNQENAVYPLGLCAERVAIFSVSSIHPNHTVKALAVTTEKELRENELPPFPCGSCRQVILELEERQQSPIQIYIVGSNNSVCVVDGVHTLLPFSFGKESL